jgi:hypothetical protein
MRPEIIDRNRKVQDVEGRRMFAVNQVDHRGAVIVAVCSLETLLTDLLVAFCRSRNSAASPKELENMFARELGSLMKNAEFAFCLGLISLDQRNALRALGTLRNKYAHNPLGQLQEEPTLYELLTDTELYKKNREALKGLNQESVFRCIREDLLQDLAELVERAQPADAGTAR